MLEPPRLLEIAALAAVARIRMRVLVVGSGGREHALVRAIARSPLVTTLFCAPGNPGIAALARLVPIPVTDIEALTEFAAANAIDLVVPGPEAPLVARPDRSAADQGIRCCGPSERRRPARRQQAVHQGSGGRRRHPDRALGSLHRYAPRARFRAPPRRADRRQGRWPGGRQGCRRRRRRWRRPRRPSSPACARAASARRAPRVVIEEFWKDRRFRSSRCVTAQDAVFLGAARDHKRVGDGDTGPEYRRHGRHRPAAGLHA